MLKVTNLRTGTREKIMRDKPEKLYLSPPEKELLLMLSRYRDRATSLSELCRYLMLCGVFQIRPTLYGKLADAEKIKLLIVQSGPTTGHRLMPIKFH
jgi:hypothetical protein